ncbi:MAG: diguanylate cyclase [Rhodocyclaceae bacterium]|nr:diguanylate cyclase [Rhodocyclaceae bacterium]
MPDFSQPSEIARETLRQLAMRRTPPTPDNYRALYHEIAGTTAAESFPEKWLKGVAAALPRTTAEQSRFARQIESAVGDKSWDSLKSAWTDIFTRLGAEQPNWANLIRDLLTQVEARHAGMTATKKRESLEHVLAASGTPDVLFSRMQSLLRNWSHAPAAEAEQELAEMPPAAEAIAPASIAAAAPAPARAASSEAAKPDSEMLELVAQLLENAVGALLIDTPDLADEATQVAAAVRGARSEEQLVAVTAKLKKFSYRLQFVAEDQAELKTALLHLLQLIIENINELVIDDQWMHGQVALVSDLVSQPLNLRRLDDVERRLKDLIFKQSSLKKSLNDAKERLKAMLATFVDRLGDFTATTGEYHDKIARCAEKVSKANDIAEISDVIDEVMRETRVIQLNARRSHDELIDMKRRVEESEKEVVRLQNELSQASEMVRLDPLTGALNRKGMDEAAEREVARARRHGANLCVALLDIDNFKKLNDTLGHQAGDDALVHLARVTRETIRPQDTLARYGGEEFVILLPDTPIDDAVTAMVRVQRELTKRFFLHKNDKVLITFSCGVAELGGNEAPAAGIARADAAMYLAKRAGKNRVVPA